jgi:hypothetical protein
MGEQMTDGDVIVAIAPFRDVLLLVERRLTLSTAGRTLIAETIL